MNNKLIKIINECILDINENVGDISTTLFSLVKYNNGLFKSDKQRDYILNKYGNNIRINKQYTFGQHGGASGSNDFIFELDDSGIIKIYKRNKSGERLTWERNEESAKRSKFEVDFKERLKHNEELASKFYKLKNTLLDNIKLIDNNYTGFKLDNDIEIYSKTPNKIDDDIQKTIHEYHLMKTDERFKNLPIVIQMAEKSLSTLKLIKDFINSDIATEYLKIKH